jgi:hypothetical protein
MITLQTLLQPHQVSEFNALVAETAGTNAQAVRWYSSETGLIVIGLVAHGKLETWFASPAQNNAQAIAAQAVVLHGLQQASQSLAALLTGAGSIAAGAINKAMH